MLSCKGLTVRVGNSSAPILNNAEIDFEAGVMNAVIGPSGCGKTTLVKAMLKILPAEGESFFCGERIRESEDIVGKVGFAPQFTCVHPMLTVREAVESALEISVSDSAERARRLENILKIIGLEEHAGKFVSSLSGGQLRRIGLGVELACDPPVMCCDEVTSGLDPLSENSILDMMQKLCRERGKTFVCIIHNLAKLDYFKRITVVHCAEIVFQGSLDELKAYFEIDSALSLYDVLNSKDVSQWRQKWSERRAEIAARRADESERRGVEASGGSAGVSGAGGGVEGGEFCEGGGSARRPSAVSQLLTLLRRRYKLFFRDTTYLFLTLAISFGFPLVVVIFALGGLPQIETLALDRNLGALEELRENLRLQIEAANTATIVTGLILFQAVLLGLMGANNSAREIASERSLYEKERLLGLRPSAYALSKIIYTLSLALFQGVWMCVFVKYICKFPGDAFTQSAQMVMVCASMTAICLAFSANFSSPEKSNLVSIYLVGFQLPLSGVVLALPEALKWVCRPFIGTYWGWAGYLTSMKDSPIYDAYVQTSSAWETLPSPALSFAVMSLQCAAALAFVFWGCCVKKWS
ncbi:MAG: ABC transporter [Verrucomicrobia bacterium]|nr:MAG: ABC transporter [Verrucomicrobiota bacterium]